MVTDESLAVLHLSRGGAVEHSGLSESGGVGLSSTVW